MKITVELQCSPFYLPDVIHELSVVLEGARSLAPGTAVYHIQPAGVSRLGTVVVEVPDPPGAK